MNRKQFGWLLVLLLVLGGAGWLVKTSREHSAAAGEIGAGHRLMGDAFPINDVGQLQIRQETNEVNLIKTDVWRVRERGDYPANFSQISELLIKLRDLKVVQNEEVSADQLVRFQLATSEKGSNAPVMVGFKSTNGQPLQSLILGKKIFRKEGRQRSQFDMGGNADGRYVLAGSNSTSVLLIGDALENVEPKPADWLNKDFFKIERPKSIAIDYPATSNSWKITQNTENGEWVLDGASADEKLDSARVSGISSPFVDPTFTDVIIASAGTAGFGLEHPIAISIQTFDDFTYLIKVGSKTNENYYLTVSVTNLFPKERIPAAGEAPGDKAKADEAWKIREKELSSKFDRNRQFSNWIYLVPAWSVDPILKDRKYLLADAKEAAKPAESAMPMENLAPPPKN